MSSGRVFPCLAGVNGKVTGMMGSEEQSGKGQMDKAGGGRMGEGEGSRMAVQGFLHLLT